MLIGSANRGGLSGSSEDSDRSGLVASVGAGAAVMQSQSRATREWRYYGADHAFTRYSPLDQVTRDNVKTAEDRLAAAGGQHDADGRVPRAAESIRYLKSTPIVIDGVVYTQNAHGLVTAFDGGDRPDALGAGAAERGGGRRADARPRLLAQRRRSADPRDPRRIPLRARCDDREVRD